MATLSKARKTRRSEPRDETSPEAAALIHELHGGEPDEVIEAPPERTRLINETIEHRDIPVDDLYPSPHNPRRVVDDSLADSIRAQGVVVPLLVRRMAPLVESEVLNKRKDPRVGVAALYEVLCGHRRLKSARAAGLKTVPCTVRQLDDLQALDLMITETVGGKPLHPIEQSRAIQDMLAMGRTPEQAAEAMGIPRTFLARRARLADLAKVWSEPALNPESTLSTWPTVILERVAALSQPMQEAVAKKLSWFTRRDNSVPTLKEFDRFLAEHFTQHLAGAPWKLDDATLNPKAGACSTCPNRSGAQPMLFDPEMDARGKVKNDRCLDSACWSHKSARHIELTMSVLGKEHKKVLAISDDWRNRDQAQKKYGDRLVESHRMAPAKQTEKGAVPAVHVDGPRRGHVEWIKPRREVSSHGMRSSGGKAKGEKAKPPTLKERRAELETRRTAWLIGAFVKELDDLAENKQLPDVLLDRSDVEVMALVATFGMSADYLPILLPGEKIWKLVDANMGCDRRDLRGTLLRGVLVQWSERLGYVSTGVHNAALIEIERVCGWIDRDFAAIKASAEQAIPEPASWANLNADGTPKSIDKPKGRGK